MIRTSVNALCSKFENAMENRCIYRGDIGHYRAKIPAVRVGARARVGAEQISPCEPLSDLPFSPTIAWYVHHPPPITKAIVQQPSSIDTWMDERSSGWMTMTLCPRWLPFRSHSTFAFTPMSKLLIPLIPLLPL